MIFFNRTGTAALGSRLRLLTAKVTEDAIKMYDMYKVDFAPKWFPVYFILAEDGECTITEIAEAIGHSQPSVTKIIKEMILAGLVKDKPDARDKRKNLVSLTQRGISLIDKVRNQCSDIELAVEEIIQESEHNLWKAIAEWELLLERKSLFERVKEQKKARENKEIEIIDYMPEYKEDFSRLNKEWIQKYFEMEEKDHQVVDHPDTYILKPGGKILLARHLGKVVGVCALMKLNSPIYDYEMAKMAVSPDAQGKNIGWILACAVIEKARSLGAKRLFLESNTMLKPAINLYHKLGFRKIPGYQSPYKRSDIQMELVLS